MTDDHIVEVATKMYSWGFTGMCCAHVYNEPLLAWPRFKTLIARIKESSPQARFLLWTNGDLLPTAEELDGVFESIVVSNYAKQDLEWLRPLCKNLQVLPGNLDWRLNPPTTVPTREPNCLRAHLEVQFDYYGNMRGCCNAWRGEISVGNLHDTPFEELWARWLKLRDSISRNPMGPDAPDRCLTCGTRYLNFAPYVPEVAARVLKYLETRDNG
jgi:hypothetical protein